MKKGGKLAEACSPPLWGGQMGDLESTITKSWGCRYAADSDAASDHHVNHDTSQAGRVKIWA